MKDIIFAHEFSAKTRCQVLETIGRQKQAKHNKLNFLLGPGIRSETLLEDKTKTIRRDMNFSQVEIAKN